MRRAAVVLLLTLLAGRLAAQGRAITSRVPGGRGGGFFPTRPLDTSPIHPRAHATAGPIAFPPADKPWIRVDTPHFVILSSAGERGAQAIADDFEKLTALLLRTSPYFRLPPSRTRVLVFAERRVVQPYLNAANGGRPVDAVGITVRHPGGSTMLLDAGARGGDIITPRHELVHELLRYNERPLPLWVEEGVAEYYSNAGLPIREHVSRLRLRPRVTLAEVLSMQPGDPRAFEADFYAQSWAAVGALLRIDQSAFFEMLRDLERGTETAAALGKHYGRSLAELSAAMRKAGAPAAPVHLHERSVAASVRAVERAELLHQLAMMLSHVAGGDEEADRHYQAALAAAPRNAETMARYAEFLAARARFDEAVLLAEQALLVTPDDPRLYAVLGAASHELPPLECAAERLRDRPDVAFHLFAAYMQRGERAKADRLFGALTETPKVNDARRILLRADIARADALARGGQLAEAARVLRELAGKMPGKTRVQLEEQAAALEKLP